GIARVHGPRRLHRRPGRRPLHDHELPLPPLARDPPREDHDHGRPGARRLLRDRPRGAKDRGFRAARAGPARAHAGARGRRDAGGGGGRGVTVDDSIDAYLDHVATERGLARKTVEAYARDLATFARSLVARRVSAPGRIGAAYARARLVALADGGLSARSQARALAAVRGFLRFLARQGTLPDDPARTIRMRRPPNRLPRALAGPEIGTLLAQPSEGKARGLRDRAL